MTRYRIFNAIVWLYLWLSDTLNPVIAAGDFWSEKAKQLLSFNRNFDNPARLLGNTIFLALLWFVIDWGLRRGARKSRLNESEGRDDEWSAADKEQFRRLLDE